MSKVKKTNIVLLSSGERVMAGPIQALSGPSSTAGPIPESGGPAMGRSLGPGLRSELSRTSQQVVYVFTTSLANR